MRGSRSLGLMSILGALPSLAGFGLPRFMSPVSSREVIQGDARRRKTTWHKQHGERECARRRRQIAAGSLRVENGLVAS